MSDSLQHTACIIGGGMSGLFTGALLAKNGYKVTVLEKNVIIGGGLQTFRRAGTIFNTGLQVFAGYEKGMLTYHFFNYLGIRDKLNILSASENAQEIVWTDKDHCYYLPKGRHAYESYLIKHFPHEKKGIVKLLDIVFEIGHTFDYLFLNPIQLHADNVKYAHMSALELIRQYVDDNELIKLIEYIGGTTGHTLKYMPALEFCMMLTLYITGSYRFIEGSKQIVDSLYSVICENEGKIINNSEVCKVEINDGRVESVVCTNGKKYISENYIWACSPKLLLQMSNYKIFRPSMMERIENYINPFTGYIVNCKLNAESFPFINSSIYISKTSEYEQLPQILFLFTQPMKQNQIWAETMDIYIPSSFNELSRWSNTAVMQRGVDYENWKFSVATECIHLISEYYPSLKNVIDSFYVASALTIRDYYGNPGGSVYGQQGLYVPIKTRVNNLFMTGQAVLNQGVAGVATVSILTSETILGRSLIEEIAKA